MILQNISSPEKLLPWIPRGRRSTLISVGAYFVMAIILSYFQAGYINADFVAYAGVAHRMLDGSGPFLTGYWSPLFSWLMSPLVYLGVDDLTAGRIVLVFGGALYVIAALRLMRKLLEHEPHELTNMLIPPYAICVVLQASIWATRLLDPDIIADGLLFLYFSIIADPALSRSKRGAVSAGLAAGLAYLAKAYMLPFVAVHIWATMAIRFFRVSEESRSRAMPFLRTGCLVLIAMLLVAGPWIAVLSHHYGKLVFSTAGTSNYANMGPRQFGNDPLWKPGMVPDYMADPHLAPSWSPFDGWSEFVHQGKVILLNVLNGFGHVFAWIVFLAMGLIAYGAARRKRRGLEMGRESGSAVLWCAMSMVLYYSGYWVINNEARYIAPVVSPLLCLIGLIYMGKSRPCSGLFRPGKAKMPGSRAAICMIIVALMASSQDFTRMERLIVRHAQSARLDPYVHIARRLSEAGLLPARFAASDWHQGLFIGYAGKCSTSYMGAPLTVKGPDMAAELAKTQTGLFLRVVPPSRLGRATPGEPGIPAGWKLAMLLDGEPSVEVYTPDR